MSDSDETGDGAPGSSLSDPASLWPLVEALTHALDLGITYFDTARSYWNGASEEVYGEVLPQWRKNIFITQ